jgi:hypothetical protein
MGQWANAYPTVWSVGLDPFLFSGTAVCEPVPSDCTSLIVVVDMIAQTVRRCDGVESTSTVPANVHSIGERHRRPLSETPIGDPYRRPLSETPIGDPYRRPLSETPIGDSHRRLPSETPIGDSHRRSSAPRAWSAAFVGNTCGDQRS